ncbi:S8 family serine peptidase [Desulfobotulus sp.]|uniref:S8 family serine peptidase n=1 Tax=Desulfobotulus sp. TaxID=1940337 RepID=UPI002A369EA6|nr:S8 family serine peptidase [Desulfobotulus sp.]MDY0164443.1 S8 family serine peptidase [Desulfobotulus sp.]
MEIKRRRGFFLEFFSGCVLLFALASSGFSDTLGSRWIVELEEPALARWGSGKAGVISSGRIILQSAESRQYLAEVAAGQEKVLRSMRSAAPGVKVATFLDGENRRQEHRYSLLFNGFSVEAQGKDPQVVMETLAGIAGVKAVHPVRSYHPSMYASLPLIEAQALWEHPAIQNKMKAGAGIRVASMDTGVHKDAPMFKPEGFSYPLDFPVGGKGFTANNNGKIIASRVYFRPNDPPSDNDKDPWPGPDGDSHGVHTAGTAAGNPVSALFLGETYALSGVAPGAWVMSYKVFYESVAGKSTFEDPEGIAALEDMVRDGADVIICSWGSGPLSTGGPHDPLDTALLNAWKAGVFVSLSMGNSGPDKATGDHPSEDYMVVAASSTGGTIAGGSLAISGPSHLPEEFQKMPAGIADFGNIPSMGSRLSHGFKTAKSVAPENILACDPFEGRPFEGLAAVVSRGKCTFDEKVRNAENAGAVFVVIHNNEGDDIRDLSCGHGCEEIRAFSVFIGKSHGEALLDWYETHGETARLTFDFSPYQAGNRIDTIARFSSRGPGVGNVLKPDIAAPGVNILSQGYGMFLKGEEKHLGYGQISGTSMAAPHIAGAAALLKQIHPLWSNTDIKAALMGTAKFLDIHTHDDRPAQPLDMGAGRVDLKRAVDPGALVHPPSLGFGRIGEGGQKTLSVSLRNLLPTPASYNVETLDTRAGFEAIRPLAGFRVHPSELHLQPYGTARLEVVFDGSLVSEKGDHQGFVRLRSEKHEVHFPVWARVEALPGSLGDVLLVDMDGSTWGEGLKDYRSYYAASLGALNLTFDVLDVKTVSEDLQIPEAAELVAYKAILLFSGDNRNRMLASGDYNRLVEYHNAGGLVGIMGQHMLSSVLDSSSFFYSLLGEKVLSTSVTGGGLPSLPLIASEDAPPVWKSVLLDLGEGGDGAANQTHMDELGKGVLRYPGGTATDKGYVLKIHKGQPSLETPGLTNPGMVVLASFGLEGVNNDRGSVRREELMKILLDWAWDRPRVQIRNVTENTPNAMGMSRFEVDFDSDTAGVAPVSVRWDLGDGSGFKGPYDTALIGHVYEKCGAYTLRAEVLDTQGNRTLASLDAEVSHCLEKEEPSACFIGGLIRSPF